jgi:hypothetical protein
MSTTPVNTVSSSFLASLSLEDCGDDPFILLEAMRTARWQKVCDFAHTYSSRARQAVANLDALRAAKLDSQLTNLAPTGDGVSAKLSGAGAAPFEAFGFKLPTLNRCNIWIVNINAGGQGTATGPVHFASIAEMNAANAAPVDDALTASFQGIDSNVTGRTVTYPDGSKTSYVLYKSSMVPTATYADIDALKSEIAATVASLYKTITDETDRLNSYSDWLLDDLMADEAQFGGTRDEDARAKDNKQTDASQDIDKARLWRLVERKRILQDQQPQGGTHHPDSKQP